MKVVGPVVGGVDSGLLRADVVRPDGLACVPGTLRDESTTGKKIYEGWCGLGHGFMRTVLAGDVNGGVGKIKNVKVRELALELDGLFRTNLMGFGGQELVKPRVFNYVLKVVSV